MIVILSYSCEDTLLIWSNIYTCLGTIEKIFDLVSCSKGPDDNLENSFLTIQSKQGLMFGIINIVGMWVLICFHYYLIDN